MITEHDIKKAMRMLENPREYLNCESVHKQLAMALELYQDRGEYNGTYESAYECLTSAAFIEEEKGGA